jgi:hypothetical protein
MQKTENIKRNLFGRERANTGVAFELLSDNVCSPMGQLCESNLKIISKILRPSTRHTQWSSSMEEWETMEVWLELVMMCEAGRMS